MTAADDSGREYRRLAFVVGCVLALVLAASLLPAISATLDESPLESAIDPLIGDSDGNGSGGGQPSMGALNPGDSTAVGNLDGSTSQSLRSLGPEVHFTVQSSEPAYWRTGTFDTYTGSGWEQQGESLPYDQPLPGPALAGDTVSYQVRLNRSATSLPTVWQPRSVSLDRSLEVTSGRAIRSADPIESGTVYRATSVRPVSEPGVLATAGQEYPDSIARRFTELPDSTPYRLTAFTDRLTESADSPYGAAKRIEDWLETNKDYSLNVSGPDTDHVASSFVFDMDAGYCEYFATAMTAMLRTQDVPARYVVGYSTGQPTGENTYTVRGMNAHAWVEAYFPDVGWVRFDPTPGSERLATERQALQRQRPNATDYDHTERGSPGETFSSADGNRTVAVRGNRTADPYETATPDRPDDETTPTPATPQSPEDETSDNQPDGPGEWTGGETPDAPASGDLNISLSERPIPGTEVTVSVSRRGRPVVGVMVLFDGDPIGKTGIDGNVSGTVPYAEHLNVTVLPKGSLGPSPTGMLPPPGGRQYAVAAPDAGTNRTRTYRVETNATLSIGGTVATGRTVLVTATVRETPVPNATVRLDGEPVGTTDDSGRLELTLPERPGSVTLTVARDPISGERTLDLRALTLDVEPALPLALPWTDVTATARLGNETAAGVPVFVDGERVGTTGPGGTLTTALPLAGSVSVSIAQFGQTVTTTVGGLWTNLLLVAGSGATLLAVGVVLSRRRYGAVQERARGALAGLLDGLLVAADLLVRAGRVGVESLQNGVDAFRAYLTGQLSAADLRARLLAWLTAVRAAAVTAVRSEPSAASTADSAPARSEAGTSIREGWETFLDRVTVRDPETKTPGEIAAYAIERDGLPAEPVRTLRDAFRSVEYGARSPADRLQAVEEALAAIETATRQPAEDGD